MTDGDDERGDAAPAKPLAGQGSLFGDPGIGVERVTHLTHAGQLAGVPAPILQLRTPGGALEQVVGAEKYGDTWRWARMGGRNDEYRYVLGRVWDAYLPILAICGLNPSTADGKKDDQTIRKEIGFTKLWGYGGFLKVNMYAIRETDPKNVEEAYYEIGANIVGPDNDQAIRDTCAGRDVVACWGAHKLTKLATPAPAPAFARDVVVLELLRSVARKVYHLGLAKEGGPRHPLYLPLATPRTEWT